MGEGGAMGLGGPCGPPGGPSGRWGFAIPGGPMGFIGPGGPLGGPNCMPAICPANCPGGPGLGPGGPCGLGGPMGAILGLGALCHPPGGPGLLLGGCIIPWSSTGGSSTTPLSGYTSVQTTADQSGLSSVRAGQSERGGTCDPLRSLS